jgi:hypothetical protein
MTGKSQTTRSRAYLTMDNAEGWQIDADLGFIPLAALGWQVIAVPWRSTDTDWDQFDAVYIGTPWDYPEDPDKFLTLLRSIDRSEACLVNDLKLVLWSMPKTYLRDLEKQGAAIVPSLWFDGMTAGCLDGVFGKFNVDRIIVKPVVSTNATDTFLLDRANLADLEQTLRKVFPGRPFVAQPFIENIQGEGEYSLFYFNGVFSHAIQKIPGPGDFRVQEEYGADITSVIPEPSLLQSGDGVMNLVKPEPVYARVDFVRGPDEQFLLMELELVEPSMYLRMDSKAPARFAEAFDRYVKQKLGSDIS